MAKVNSDGIVQAAVLLFNRNGYHATSMDDIAQAVSIKKPSLYHHFGSKEEILLAILETGMEQLIQEVHAIVESELNPVEKLRAAIRVHATVIASNPQGAAVFLREDRGLGEDYLDRYLSMRDQFEKLFRSIIAEGIQEGVFRPTDVSIAVHAVLGMVNWMTRWYRQQGRLSADQVADIFVDLFMNGLVDPDQGIDQHPASGDA